MEKGLKLESICSNETVDPAKYQSLVGSLLYLALNTRIDVCYAVNQLSSFNKEPDKAKFKIALRVLRYLYDYKDYGLIFKKKEKKVSYELNLLVDANWGTDEKGKSLHGYILKCNGDIIAYRSKGQKNVTLSTCEAEFFGNTEASKEVLYMMNMLEFLGRKVVTPVILENDNFSAVQICQSEGSIYRTRHLSLRSFWIVEKVKEGILKVIFKQGSELEADLLTKSLGKNKHWKFTNKLLMKLEEGVVRRCVTAFTSLLKGFQKKEKVPTGIFQQEKNVP